MKRPALPAGTSVSPGGVTPARVTKRRDIDRVARTVTLEELEHERSRRTAAKGPRYQRHPLRDGAVLFRGSAEEHRDRLLEATGCEDVRLAERLLCEVADALPEGQPTTSRLESAGSMLASLAPRNPLEGMLCVQMAAVHQVAMSLLASVDTHDGGPAAVAATRLLRTFSMQVEALARLRSPGVTEQRVIVQHVTVADGGQAVIGAVSRPATGEGDG